MVYDFGFGFVLGRASDLSFWKTATPGDLVT